MKFVDLRKKIGTQEEFAKRVNMSQQSICAYEKGISMPKTKDLRKIATVLGISIDELVDSFDRS